jgi:hypothetical protein
MVCIVMYVGNLGLRISTESDTCVYWTPFRRIALPRGSTPAPSLDSIDETAPWSIPARCQLLKRLKDSTNP